MMLPYFGPENWNFVGALTTHFILDLVFAYILICKIYANGHRIREYSFSFFVSNILIFIVTSLMASVKIKTGFAFGLFAILSILRFRTEQIQFREMTFLFSAIILGVVNSLAAEELSIVVIFLADVFLCAGVLVCEKTFIGVTDSIMLVYDNTKFLAKDKRQELHEDIKTRFGYEVLKVVILEMNYLTDSAKVKLIYRRK